jgi:hypothetical protein
MGLEHGQPVERKPYDLLFGECKARTAHRMGRTHMLILMSVDLSRGHRDRDHIPRRRSG